MKPICVSCRRFFRMKKAGVYFIEGMPKPGFPHAELGSAAPDQWTPYKVWAGDRWECEGCGHVIVSGVGWQPLAEHYQPNFQKTIEQTHADQLQVNDC